MLTWIIYRKTSPPSYLPYCVNNMMQTPSLLYIKYRKDIEDVEDIEVNKETVKYWIKYRKTDIPKKMRY